MQASTSSIARHSVNRVAQVANAYRIGLRQPIPYRPRPDDPSMMLEGLPLEDELRILESAKVRGTAMKAARSGDLSLARRRLQVAEKFLDFNAMERRSVCIGLQLHRGVEAYILYKDEDYDAARRSMREALCLMNELQEDFGYGFCDGRRVHLARNLLRLDADGGNPLRAAQAAFKLLLYATGDDQTWPYPALQSKATDRSMTKVERHMVFNQVARELVLLFLREDAATKSALLEEGDAFMLHLRTMDPFTGEARRATMCLWLDMQRALFEGRLDDFMEQAASFFRHGRLVPALWYGIALDVTHVCDCKGGLYEALRQQIIDDAGTLKQLLRIDYHVAFKE